MNPHPNQCDDLASGRRPTLAPWTHLSKPTFYALMPLHSIAVACAIHPAFVIQARIYARTTAPAETVQSVLRTVLNRKSLGQGLSTSVASSMGVTPLYLTALEVTRHYTTSSVLAGSMATFAGLLVSVPRDVSVMNLSKYPNTVSAWTVGWNVYTEHGLRHGLYRGFWSSFAAQAPSSIGLWAVYDRMRQAYADHPETQHRIPLLAAISGAVSALITSPIDAIRATQQLNISRPPTTVTTATTITTATATAATATLPEEWSTRFRPSKEWRTRFFARFRLSNVLCRTVQGGWQSMCVLTSYELLRHAATKKTPHNR